MRARTVVFADLTGSTRVFEVLGNVRATELITSLTQGIAGVCVAHLGRVVKMLGDGVLAVFPDGESAITAVVELQRAHTQRLEATDEGHRMHLQVGVASGEIVEVAGDCYGDAVNVASRLSDLSGAEQIWASESVIDQVVGPVGGARFRSLGAIPIRGKAQTLRVYRVDWQEETPSWNVTEPGVLEMFTRGPAAPAAGIGIELFWLDQKVSYSETDFPVYLGRESEAQFVVPDQRVSRLHTRLDLRNGRLMLSDASTYGTWVRFAGSSTVLALRREECVLHGEGEIALGASFEDFTARIVSFRIAERAR